MDFSSATGAQPGKKVGCGSRLTGPKNTVCELTCECSVTSVPGDFPGQNIFPGIEELVRTHN